jgi:hypothetical protein
MKGFIRRVKMVNRPEDLRGSCMRIKTLYAIGLAGLGIFLSGCRASPLYVGQWDGKRLAAPAAVPRDDRGEPIMTNLPPLGPIPIAISKSANAEPPKN